MTTTAGRNARTTQWSATAKAAARCQRVYLRNAKLPMLFVSGTNDFAYPINILEMSCALPSGVVTRCVRVGMAHGHEPGWAPREIGIFADQHLMNGVPLPVIGACRYSQDLLEGSFSSRLLRPVVPMGRLAAIPVIQQNLPIISDLSEALSSPQQNPSRYRP
jgi:hypothetical protein